MEHCSQTLSDQMKQRAKFKREYTEQEILKIMLDISTALYQLHQIDFAHMDVKPGRVA